MTQGLYGGANFGIPQLWGLGGGLYVDNYGNYYPQFYYGIPPRLSASAGYSPDLEGLLTGPSVSGSVGNRSFKFNFGRSADSTGVGFGTPGVGFTYGFGPFRPSGSPPSFDDRYGRWADAPSTSAPVEDDAAPFDHRFGNWGNVPARGLGESRPPILRELLKSLGMDAHAGVTSISKTNTSPPAPAFQPDAVYSPGGNFIENFPPNLVSGPQSTTGAQQLAGKVRLEAPDLVVRGPDQARSPANPTQLGIVSGKPMSEWYLPPQLFDLTDRPGASKDWLDILAGSGAPNFR